MSPTACTHLSATGAHIDCAIGGNAPHDCAACSAYSPALAEAERSRCEVWTRVMGYHRPISAFNAGKLAEHQERKPFAQDTALG